MPTSKYGLTVPVLGTDPPNGPAAFTAFATSVMQALSAGLQQGVIDAGSFQVTQKGAGANMSVDVAGHVGAGAYVQDDAVAGQLLAYVKPAGAVTNLAIGNNTSGNPRVDRVVMDINGAVSVLAGTATSGATLDNADSHGAAAVPASTLLLADILVANSASTIPNTVIRDRRTWARGAFKTAKLTTGTHPLTSNTLAEVDTTTLKFRIECSGVPVRITYNGFVANQDTSPHSPAFTAFVDGSSVDGISNLSDAGIIAAGDEANEGFTYTTVPTPGSHVFSLAYQGGGTNVSAWIVNSAQVFTVEELVRQNTQNNATTSG